MHTDPAPDAARPSVSRSWAAVLGLVAVLASVLTGCGTDTDDASAAGGKLVTSTTVAPAPSDPSAPPSTSTPTSAAADGSCSIELDPLGTGVLVHEGAERAYNVTVPPGSGPFPVVLNLHGVSGTKDHQDAATGLPTTGVHEGFVTVTPETQPGETRWDLTLSGPDLAYLDALLERVRSSPCVDAERVYAAGFSMGGFLAQQLTCLDPDRFVAIAVVGGMIEMEACATAAAGSVTTPLVAVHGTADGSIGYDGTMARRVSELVGYAEGPDVLTLAGAWAARAGCTDPPVVTPSAGAVRYDHCDVVSLVAVEGVDHVWPGPAVGSTVDANEVIWDFFDAH